MAGIIDKARNTLGEALGRQGARTVKERAKERGGFTPKSQRSFDDFKKLRRGFARSNRRSSR